MMAQAEGLALHFKVPAVLSGSGAQAFVQLRICWRHVIGFALDASANRVELLDERVERSTDARQRGSAFLIELPQNGFVPFGRFAQVHDLIVGGTPVTSSVSRFR
jgi:hypothetical protein